MTGVVILLTAIAIVVFGILVLKLHACLALLFAALFVSLTTTQTDLKSYAESKNMNPASTTKLLESTAPERISDGFGSTCGKIGIVIAMASIIGKCMLESGSADRIVRTTLRILGQARAGISFVGSGFLLGIPVFFDTVFYLMVPLAKAMRLQTGKNYLMYILCIVAGGSMAHSLVPPTPGPLVVATELNVDLLTMIIGGCLVGLVTSSVGYLFVVWLNRRIEIPLRDEGDLDTLLASTQKEDKDLPPLWLALLPIVLPVALIAAGTATNTYFKQLNGSEAAEWMVSLRPTLTVLGNKNSALIIAAVISLLTLAWQQKGDRKQLSQSMQIALSGAGVIILITASGGAFGAAVQRSSIARTIGSLQLGEAGIWILPIAFLITTIVRTAQGSATVAMMTAAGLLQSVVANESFTLHPVYLALAIGCGSKPIAWMADSGFWVICKMSGMTESEALRTVTPLSIVMGVVGLAATMVGAAIWPQGFGG